MKYRDSIHKFENLMEEMQMDEAFDLENTFSYRKIGEHIMGQDERHSFVFSLNDEDDIQDEYACGKGPYIRVDVVSVPLYYSKDKPETSFDIAKGRRISYPMRHAAGDDNKLSINNIAFSNSSCSKRPFPGAERQTKQKILFKAAEKSEDFKKMTGAGNALKVITTSLKIILDLIAGMDDIGGNLFIAAGSDDRRQRIYEKAAKRLKGTLPGIDVDVFPIDINWGTEGTISGNTDAVVFGKRETIEEFKRLVETYGKEITRNEPPPPRIIIPARN